MQLSNLNLSELEKIDDIKFHDNSAKNSPVVRFINNILNEAIQHGVSDIHFEPFDGKYRIRYRLNGILVTAAQPPFKLANVITARLKIMSNLDISERRIPQDGRFIIKMVTLDAAQATTAANSNDTILTTQANSSQRTINCRINSCPTLHGEKIVLRILESNTDLLQINSLGMTATQQAIFLNALQHSQGMILVTGPTGSGKTTTLYTAINQLNTIEKNIFTIEDPVEIQLAGINQVHINLKTGLSFAVALRAFLRQDPDIIMVGEIRDVDTAAIAVQASQTGHLVLSTLHTNSAPETLVRLANMGIPAYNIASSISLIIAQRLLRRLCDYCKKILDIPKTTLREVGFTEDELDNIILYGPGNNTCEHCLHGYQSRVAIFEMMPISDQMARLIMAGANALALADQARDEDIPSLYQSGLDIVRAGLTSFTELNRIL